MSISQIDGSDRARASAALAPSWTRRGLYLALALYTVYAASTLDKIGRAHV